MVQGNSPAAQGATGSRTQTMMREFNDRIRRLERQRSGMIGRWRLSEDPSGNLIATHTTTGAVRVIANP